MRYTDFIMCEKCKMVFHFSKIIFVLPPHDKPSLGYKCPCCENVDTEDFIFVTLTEEELKRIKREHPERYVYGTL